MTTHLPQHHRLPIDKLVAIFNKTTATYKYYWLLSIIEMVEGGNEHIPKQKLF